MGLNVMMGELVGGDLTWGEMEIKGGIGTLCYYRGGEAGGDLTWGEMEIKGGIGTLCYYPGGEAGAI